MTNNIAGSLVMGGFIVLLIGAIVWRLSPEQLADLLKNTNLVVWATAALFVTLLVFHTLTPQDWTADILKVVVGAMVGAGAGAAAAAAKSPGATGGANVAGSQFGDDTKIAGRDINEVIEQMVNEIGEVRESVINSYGAMTAVADLSRQVTQPKSYLFHTIYDRQQRAEVVDVVVEDREEEGWRLEGVTSDYAGMDGMILIFSREAGAVGPKVEFARDTTRRMNV